MDGPTFHITIHIIKIQIHITFIFVISLLILFPVHNVCTQSFHFPLLTVISYQCFFFLYIFINAFCYICFSFHIYIKFIVILN